MEMLLFFLSFLLLLTQNSELMVTHAQSSLLPQDEVNALNSMAITLGTSDEFSRNSCLEEAQRNICAEIKCNCRFENDSVCHVTYIDYADCDLSGAIPPETANLSYLEKLYLSNNMLVGSIPNAFIKLSRLSILGLGSNNLSGPIPPIIGEMKSLQAIDVSANWFSSSIPPEFASLQSLVSLDLSNNQLSGRLPQGLGKLVNLQYLYLNNNNFSDEFPKSFAALKNMTVLHVTGNNFYGKIPDYVANWKNLRTLALMGNSFEGPFPDALSSLKVSELHVTDLAGSIGGRGFPFPNLSRMTSLQRLTLRNCSLTGQIPDFIFQIPSLLYMDLSFNNLTGKIPHFIHHQNLKYIYLKGNKLIGPVPRWLAVSKNSFVDISENSFTSLPVRLGENSTTVNTFACCANNAENLSMPWQRSNYYCHSDESSNDHLYIDCGGDGTPIDNGVYYEADSQPYGGSTFFLSVNKSWGYSSMGKFLWANLRKYTMSSSGIDERLYKTARVAPISLKYYGFCMKNKDYRVSLHFAEISDGGKRIFDVEIQGKKVLENFNIREAAGGIYKTAIKNFTSTVRNNRLEIHLYWNGRGSFVYPMQYYGPLISAISVSPVPKTGKKLSVVTIAAPVGSALVLLLMLILVFIYKKAWLGGKELHREELQSLELQPGSSFNFRQIKAATQNFSHANKIGEGGFGPVYKGVLPNGTAIAVKQLSSKSKQGAREFVNELGTIFALQHPNLVKLLGCCTEDNQLLLVYEYMENNSLSHALFGPEELRLRLNWLTRYKICLGIAKGLAFLHEESKLKIVHRDIKPTNVLLDEDLNAKISDFGIAKLYDTEKTHVITRIAGTTGYMAPEYAMRGHLTSKADVYSFGVVILEIVSGKNSTSYRPNDESVYLLDLAYVLQEKGDLISLVDPMLGHDYSVKQARTILELAMLCTNQSPTLRPTMSEVVNILEGKSKMKVPSFNAPYSTDDFAMAKVAAGLTPCSGSGSNSKGMTSNTMFYDLVSTNEEEYSIFGDYSSEKLAKADDLTN